MYWKKNKEDTSLEIIIIKGVGYRFIAGEEIKRGEGEKKGGSDYLFGQS